ncbi:MAG TPA: ImmA/IrrE family metallo-endopeptidase [Burkholderiales bacterium]|nr:ImmA/IrrE family metallo-endopeptidase [Burkholderiales bacterium]
MNSDLLVWAREASRVDLATVAQRLKVTEAKLQAWEDGTQLPTLTQLRKLARLYKRSVGVFFLQARPVDPPPPVDYRRIELSLQHVISPELAQGIRAAEVKRDAALEIFAQWEAEPPAFQLGIDPNSHPEETAHRITERLGITTQNRQQWANEYDAMNAWKAAVESLGVLVMQVSGVSVKEMRGCALALSPLPIILLNSKDKPLGRVFSLMHELVHLARAESGLCDVTEQAPRGDREEQIEVYCNHVAGSILVPFDELLRHPLVTPALEAREWSSDELQTLRRAFWASREVILRRLLMAEKTTSQFYKAQRQQWRQQFAGDEGESAGGFTTFPRRVVLANGRFLTRLAIDAYDASVITGSDLSRILGAKLDHLPKILGVLGEREAA